MTRAKRQRCVIDFVCVGPQKTGTTWLYEVLRRDGRVDLPERTKETFYWDKRYSRGVDWYLGQFGKGCAGRLRGEVGPTYFTSSAAAARISRDCESVKVVVTLRNPWERVFSMYLHELRKGRVKGPLLKAIEEFPVLLEGSRYATHLPRWINMFGMARLKVVVVDDLWRDRRASVTDLFEFIGLSGGFRGVWPEGRVNRASVARWQWLALVVGKVADRFREMDLYWPIRVGKALGLKDVVFSGGKIPVITREEKRLLAEMFIRDVEYVEDLLGRDLGQWKRA